MESWRLAGQFTPCNMILKVELMLKKQRHPVKCIFWPCLGNWSAPEVAGFHFHPAGAAHEGCGPTLPLVSLRPRLNVSCNLSLYLACRFPSGKDIFLYPYVVDGDDYMLAVIPPIEQ